MAGGGHSIRHQTDSLACVAELNGGVARHGEPGSGAMSPISKPGTPVPGGGSIHEFQGVPRAGSSQLPCNILERLGSQEPGRLAQTSGRAPGNTTPGKERPVTGAAAMKKVSGLVQPGFLLLISHSASEVKLNQSIP